jgi:large subunit ribosomal protein L4
MDYKDSVFEMTAVDVYDLNKKKVSQVKLNDKIFNVTVKDYILHQALIGLLSNRRSGTASSKSRSEVTASGAKLWRQKGTGRARAGQASSPTRKGGGVAFGPSPRKYTHKVPKKVKKAALRMALTDKALAQKIIVVEKFELSEAKTKNFVAVMQNFNARKALIVTHDRMENLEKSSRNVPRFKVMRYQGLNAYDVLKYDQLIMEKSALVKMEEALAI